MHTWTSLSFRKFEKIRLESKELGLKNCSTLQKSANQLNFWTFFSWNGWFCSVANISIGSVFYLQKLKCAALKKNLIMFWKKKSNYTDKSHKMKNLQFLGNCILVFLTIFSSLFNFERNSFIIFQFFVFNLSTFLSKEHFSTSLSSQPHKNLHKNR